MPKNQNLMEDMAALCGSLLTNLFEARHEVKAQAKQRVEIIAKQLNLVSREEFDAAFGMLTKARLVQEELNDRLKQIEAKLGLSSSSTKAKAKKVNLPSVKDGNRRTKRR